MQASAEPNVCARREQKPSLLGLCRAAANFRASERRAELVRAMPSAAENVKKRCIYMNVCATFHCAGCTSVAGCKPNCCTQPRAAPWENDVALIKVSRSVRATCFMRGNAPWGVKGNNGLRAFGAWHFCAGAKMPNVSIAVNVAPGRCPGLWATFGLTARPNHLLGVLHKRSYKCTFGGGSA